MGTDGGGIGTVKGKGKGARSWGLDVHATMREFLDFDLVARELCGRGDGALWRLFRARLFFRSASVQGSEIYPYYLILQ